MTVTIQPGDFCVIPMGGRNGVLVDWAQWAQQLIEQRHAQKHGVLLPQKYGHAEIWIGDGLTASAYPNRNGIRTLGYPPEQLQDALWSSGLIDLTTQQRDGIVQWCYEHAHVRYSALDYTALTAHTLGMQTSWLQRYIEQQDSMICSMYVDAAYMANEVQLFTDERWRGFVTPLALAMRLEEFPRLPSNGPGQAG
jgi:hypothetical protein